MAGQKEWTIFPQRTKPYLTTLATLSAKPGMQFTQASGIPNVDVQRFATVDEGRVSTYMLERIAIAQPQAREGSKY